VSTPISRIEITADSVSIAGRSPDPAGILLASFAQRGLVAYDEFAGFGVYYALLCELHTDAATNTAWESRYVALAQSNFGTGDGSYLTGVPTDPTTWRGILNPVTFIVYHLTLSDGGASFFAGGTIALEKDFDNNLLNFVTPAGTIVVPLDTVPGVGFTTNKPLSKNSLQSGLFHSGARYNDTLTWSETTNWRDFWIKSGGVKVTGSPMTAADPGSWDPAVTNNRIILFPLGYPETIYGQTTDLPGIYTQNTLTFQSEFLYIPNPTSFYYGGQQDYRRWKFPTHPGAPGAVAVTLREHGPIFASYISSGGSSLDTVSLRRTFDNSVTWVTADIAISGSGTNDSPNLAWNGQRLDAVWHNSVSGILQSSSTDLGATWSNPLSISITGTSPKFLVDSNHGIQYYFYQDASFNLQLVRSADYGSTFIDSTPLLVASAIGAQTVAGEFASDGSLLVGYTISGVWTQVRSRDGGLSWW
jgi:hypothetical protein